PPAETGFTFTPASRDGPPGSGYGAWRLRTPGPGPGLIITLESLATDPCDHRFQAKGHDPGVNLRHLSQVRHATSPTPICPPPGPPPRAPPSTTLPTKPAAPPVSVTPVRSAVTTPGPNSPPGGEWISAPTGPSDGQPQPGGPTPPNPRATRSRRAVS